MVKFAGTASVMPTSVPQPGAGAQRVPRPQRLPRDCRGQLTLTAAQAASTALYWVLPAPYRSLAAFSVAVRAPW